MCNYCNYEMVDNGNGIAWGKLMISNPDGSQVKLIKGRYMNNKKEDGYYIFIKTDFGASFAVPIKKCPICEQELSD